MNNTPSQEINPIQDKPVPEPPRKPIPVKPESKPTPYKGTDPYIFVSYAHKDKDIVYPIISHLIKMGIRIWFDEAIAPGTEWDENIAIHVQNCSGMVAFISQKYLESDNCRDELNYARDLKKERLLVYLDDAVLPPGMAMRMNRIQAIRKYAYTDEKDFYNKMMECAFIARNKEPSA